MYGSLGSGGSSLCAGPRSHTTGLEVGCSACVAPVLRMFGSHASTYKLGSGGYNFLAPINWVLGVLLISGGYNFQYHLGEGMCVVSFFPYFPTSAHWHLDLHNHVGIC